MSHRPIVPLLVIGEIITVLSDVSSKSMPEHFMKPFLPVKFVIRSNFTFAFATVIRPFNIGKREFIELSFPVSIQLSRSIGIKFESKLTQKQYRCGIVLTYASCNFSFTEMGPA